MDISSHVSDDVSDQNPDDISDDISEQTADDYSGKIELNSSLAAPPLQKRFLLTEVGTQQLAFPAEWVAEIMLVERSQILRLPFYDPMLLGVIHHQSKVVPLVAAAYWIQDTQRRRIKEILTVVRLNHTIGSLAGIGIVVDQVIGNQQLLDQMLDIEISTESNTAGSYSAIKVFQPEDIPQSIWQPRTNI